MLFNSFEFLLFFPIVTALYFMLPHSMRWLHLLIASCIFYMYFIPVYILILFGTIIIDYIAGIWIEKAHGEQRRLFLIISIVTNVGVLAVFKYYNFFLDSFNQLAPAARTHLSLPVLNMLLPIGLSFHTFQAMSYTIEVYRGNQKAERHLGIYALYVMFYPQLVAGPIERPQNLLHQFREKHPFSYGNAVKGLRQMLWGMIKKVVIADRLAVVVDTIFNDPHQSSGIGLAVGAFFFAFQIFCDFSGYSDIAIGAARVMGFHLMTNFNKPYHARNVAEFWKRWHISLSTWFKDYLYISLGGNRVTLPRMYFNLFLVFLISGFWHGANWTFLIWGALNGFYLIFGLMTAKPRKQLMQKMGILKGSYVDNVLNVIATFVLIDFAWIFFRAANVGDAFFIIKKLGDLPSEAIALIKNKNAAFLNLPDWKELLLPGFTLILFLEVIHMTVYRYKLEMTFDKRPPAFRWAVYYAGILLLFFLGVYEKRQFIYFQF